MKEREEIYKEDNMTRQRRGYHERSGDSWYGEDQETKKTMTIVKQKVKEEETTIMQWQQHKLQVKKKERKKNKQKMEKRKKENHKRKYISIVKKIPIVLNSQSGQVPRLDL